MTALREYVISLTATAMILSAVMALTPEGTGKKAVKLLAGVIMATAVLGPLADVSLPDLENWTDVFVQDGVDAAREGQIQYESQRNRIIKQQLEEYIQDRAEALGSSLLSDVTLNGEGIPEKCELEGNLDPGQKVLLEAILERELGIAKENLIWNGS